MPDFLFVFGYESPEEWRTNRAQGTDFEPSHAVWIAAPNGDAALRAGSSYAERYVQSLFRQQGMELQPSWSASGFAHWIEHQPSQQFSGIALDMFDRIEA